MYEVMAEKIANSGGSFSLESKITRLEIIEDKIISVILENSKGQEGSIWLIGTIVHFDSFLQTIYDGHIEADREGRQYAWTVMYKKAIEDGIPLWPNYFSKKKLMDIRRRFSDMGLVHKFAQEYLNEARDLDSAKFKIDRINYYLRIL